MASHSVSCISATAASLWIRRASHVCMRLSILRRRKVRESSGEGFFLDGRLSGKEREGAGVAGAGARAGEVSLVGVCKWAGEREGGRNRRQEGVSLRSSASD